MAFFLRTANVSARLIDSDEEMNKMVEEIRTKERDHENTR